MRNRWIRNRWLSMVVAVGYGLTITTAALFHNHTLQQGERYCQRHLLARAASTDSHHGNSRDDAGPQNAPKSPARCPSDSSHCPVCHFLAHKPAPAAEATVVVSGRLVQQVPAPAPTRIVASVFSAWQSRGPPCFA
jgi:Protein of unknown function (DUF2946)